MLSLVAVANISRGVRRAWQDDGDVDMQARAAEYDWFRSGVYPNRSIVGTAAPRALPYTVYPPYALPMFAVFFDPGGRLQGRVVVELLSVASLAVIGWYGWRELRFAGPALAAIGAVAAAAITGTLGALSAGQFSIVCVGLIVQQILFLERGKPVAAGVCWALAMIKPQIALAFAVLFVTERRWRGLLTGLAILAVLSLAACAWTDVSPLAVADHWLFKASLSFAEEAGTPGPGELARSLGLRSRTVLAAALLVFCGMLAWLWWASGRAGGRLPLLPLAGACAVAGELLFYHQFYDHIMLAPALFAMLALAAISRSPPATAVAAVMAASVWMPQRFVTLLPGNQPGRAAVWAIVALTLSWWSFRRAADERLVTGGADSETA